MSFECHLSVTVGRLSANQRKPAETGAIYWKLDFPEPIVLSKALSKLLVLLSLYIYISIHPSIYIFISVPIDLSVDPLI